MNVKDLIYAYIIGDSFGLSRLKNSGLDTNNLIDNKTLNIPKGSISSMSTFMFSTLTSIAKTNSIDTVDILNKMCTSLIIGKYTSNGKIYDLDNTTFCILEYYSKKNNLNYIYDENDLSVYSINRLLPFIIYSFYNGENLDNLVSLVYITNINETVLCGIFIYYKYILNLLNGLDKYKALKIELPTRFDNKVKNKFKDILKGKIYYNEIEFNSDIINVLKIVFYVILNCDNFNDYFLMLNNIEGNINIYSSLIFVIGYILYGNDDLEKLKKDILNKREFNKYINEFRRVINEKVY